MKLSTKYNIDDKIYIKELKIWGRIIGIEFYSRLKYDVRFFNGYDPKNSCFLEDELSLESDNGAVGFKKD